MKIDLSAIPLIDNHAHPFPTTRLSKGNYAQRFNFSCWLPLLRDYNSGSQSLIITGRR